MLFFYYALAALAVFIASPVIQLQVLTPTTTWLSLGGFQTTSIIVTRLSGSAFHRPKTCFYSGMPQDFGRTVLPDTLLEAWRNWPYYVVPASKPAIDAEPCAPSKAELNVDPATKVYVSESHVESAPSPSPAAKPVYIGYSNFSGRFDTPFDIAHVLSDVFATDEPRRAAVKIFGNPAVWLNKLIRSGAWRQIMHLLFRTDTRPLRNAILFLLTAHFVLFAILLIIVTTTAVSGHSVLPSSREGGSLFVYGLAEAGGRDSGDFTSPHSSPLRMGQLNMRSTEPHLARITPAPVPVTTQVHNRTAGAQNDEAHISDLASVLEPRESNRPHLSSFAHTMVGLENSFLGHLIRASQQDEYRDSRGAEIRTALLAQLEGHA
ncbi:hypothetical protein FA95DRAFT_1605271 [Auriscalpium vulgare]|uniref:Uncharacterized protein n=1 Tax=Auriscalpium vulgare TaxID=40419 RepID=A0ACB8RXR5_9AGAM|nr:hypothetical protein FA95DRAFT_1605271 [Auriscalpium vulgare]